MSQQQQRQPAAAAEATAEPAAAAAATAAAASEGPRRLLSIVTAAAKLRSLLGLHVRWFGGYQAAGEWLESLAVSSVLLCTDSCIMLSGRQCCCRCCCCFDAQTKADRVF